MSGIVVLADMELGLMLDIEYKPGRSLLPSYSLICCFVWWSFGVCGVRCQLFSSAVPIELSSDDHDEQHCVQ